jgi:hypothetical protein
MGEVAANADGEGKVCLKIITSQAVPPPALLRGEPLMLYKSLYWSLFDKFFDRQKFRGIISTEFFVISEQEGNDCSDSARNHKACEDPAEKSYPEFSVFVHFICFLSYQLSVSNESWSAERSLSGIVVPDAGIFSFLYPFEYASGILSVA